MADAKSLDMLYDNLYVLPQMGYLILLVLFGCSLFLFVTLSIVLMVLSWSSYCSHASSSFSTERVQSKTNSNVLVDVQYIQVDRQIDVSSIQLTY